MPIKKSLKIFVDAYLLNKEAQGTKTYIKELYKEFAFNNAHIQVFLGCFEDNKLIEEFSQHDNIHFIFFRQKNRVLRMFFEIPKIIKHHQFNFAHFQYVLPFVRSKTCKYILTIHDILFNDFKDYFSLMYRLKRNYLFKISAHTTDYLLTVSNYSKARIQEVYRLKNKDIFITPNGVNKQYLKEYNKEKSEEYISNKYGIKNFVLYVSRIEPRKNQQALLKVFLETKKENLHLVFIGKKSIKNNEFNSVINQLSKKELEKIYLLDEVESHDLIEFYRASKLFIYPTLAEGFGIPPIEAAALKVPVLCSNRTAMIDFSFFKPHLIDITNFKDFKEHFNLLLELKGVSNQIEIHNYIKQHYTWMNASKVLSSIIK